MSSLFQNQSTTRNASFRWVMLAANFLVLFITWSPYAAFGVFFPRLTDDFGWQRGDVASVLSVSMFVGLPLALIVGKAMDQHGPRVVALLGVILCGVSYVLASTVQSLWQLYLYAGIVFGIGFAGSYIIPTTTVSRWFQQSRGLAAGILLSGQAFAYLLGPLLAANLIAGVGWRSAFLVLGLAVLALAIPPALVLRNPPKPPQPVSGADASRQRTPAISFRKAMGTSTCVMLFTIWACMSFIQMMFTIHVVPLVVDKGINLTVAAGALSSYGIGLLLGRILSGLSVDRLGSRFVFSLSTLVGSLGVAALLVTPDLALITASTLAVGVYVSAADTAYVKALPDIVGFESLGTLMSGLSMGFRVGAALGPAFAGFLFDATQVYALPFGVSILGALASIWLFYTATRPEQRLQFVLIRKTEG